MKKIPTDSDVTNSPIKLKIKNEGSLNKDRS